MGLCSDLIEVFFSAKGKQLKFIVVIYITYSSKHIFIEFNFSDSYYFAEFLTYKIEFIFSSIHVWILVMENKKHKYKWYQNYMVYNQFDRLHIISRLKCLDLCWSKTLVINIIVNISAIKYLNRIIRVCFLCVFLFSWKEYKLIWNHGT